MEIEVTKTVKVTRCYRECLHFDLDGGPSSVMICNHPDAPDMGYIISHPACDDGFPLKCPLLASNKVNPADPMEAEPIVEIDENGNCSHPIDIKRDPGG